MVKFQDVMLFSCVFNFWLRRSDLATKKRKISTASKVFVVNHFASRGSSEFPGFNRETLAREFSMNKIVNLHVLRMTCASALDAEVSSRGLWDPFVPRIVRPRLKHAYLYPKCLSEIEIKVSRKLTSSS